MKRVFSFCVILLGLAIRPALANDTVYYYHTDAQGTAVVVTDASHNVVERSYYGPYGEVLNRALRDGPGYTGHEEDAATGLDNMQQRYYDPANGRFPSPDPMEVDTRTAANFNRYAYAADNPYRYVDPDGRAGKDCGADGGCGKNPNQDNDDQARKRADAVTGTHIRGISSGGELRTIQVNEPGAPTSKIAQDMVSNNPGDRVSAAHAAMDYFGIKPADGKLDIMYDSHSDDYGDTWQLPNDHGHGVVMLGPKAYVTWSHLGSTLGHEIEVHWNTQILIFGNYKGTRDYDWREMQAYKYNIREAERFGNSPSEVKEFHDLLGRYKNGYQNLPDEVYTTGH